MGNAVNYGSEQFFMCPMFVTECFHNKCFKLSTLCSVYISPGCESDMILSVMTLLWSVIIIVTLGGAAIFTAALHIIYISKEVLPLYLTFVMILFRMFRILRILRKRL